MLLHSSLYVTKCIGIASRQAYNSHNNDDPWHECTVDSWNRSTLYTGICASRNACLPTLTQAQWAVEDPLGVQYWGRCRWDYINATLCCKWWALIEAFWVTKAVNYTCRKYVMDSQNAHCEKNERTRHCVIYFIPFLSVCTTFSSRNSNKHRTSCTYILYNFHLVPVVNGSYCCSKINWYERMYSNIYIFRYRIHAYRLDVACKVLNERSSAGWNDLERFIYSHLNTTNCDLSS